MDKPKKLTVRHQARLYTFLTAYQASKSGCKPYIGFAGLEEALIASLAEAEGGAGASGAPAASKHAVKSLLREHLTEQRLQQLGGSGTECAVCRSAASCYVMQHSSSTCTS